MNVRLLLAFLLLAMATVVLPVVAVGAQHAAGERDKLWEWMGVVAALAGLSVLTMVALCCGWCCLRLMGDRGFSHLPARSRPYRSHTE